MTVRIARHDLQTRLNVECPPVLVEALGSGYWADAHLPGALNIPADQVDRLAPRLLPDLDAEIVMYCSTTCQNSDIAAKRLIDLGYRNVLVYEGGKEDWIEHGLPVERSGQRDRASIAPRIVHEPRAWSPPLGVGICAPRSRRKGRRRSASSRRSPVPPRIETRRAPEGWTAAATTLHTTVNDWRSTRPSGSRASQRW